MYIRGYDTAGVEWTGDAHLDVDDDRTITGTIDWQSSSGLSGREWVTGTRDDGQFDMEGTRVSTQDIVPCSYEGTWVGRSFEVTWFGRCPDGSARSD